MVATLTDHDKAHMERILGGYGDWFSAHLMRLIMKADPHNRLLLSQIYPDHVQAYEDYLSGEYGGDE